MLCTRFFSNWVNLTLLTSSQIVYKSEIGSNFDESNWEMENKNRRNRCFSWEEDRSWRRRQGRSLVSKKYAKDIFEQEKQTRNRSSKGFESSKYDLNIRTITRSRGIVCYIIGLQEWTNREISLDLLKPFSNEETSLSASDELKRRMEMKEIRRVSHRKHFTSHFKIVVDLVSSQISLCFNLTLRFQLFFF